MKKPKKNYWEERSRMSNIPKLRFPEFSGEWEEKKLSDIASFSKGKGYTKNDLVNDGSPIILYGRMYTKYETVISDIDTFVNLQEGSIISKGGEIIVPASGETAEEISRASVVKNKGIILGGDLNIISLQKDKYNPEFFALTISSGTSQKRLSKLAQGKSVVHLHNEDLSGLQIKVPSLAEQQKIADFLSNVDSIITAETKILNALQKKKKALMQKLFTRQLRFKSADGTDFPAWEEKKLGECVEILDSQRKPIESKERANRKGEYPYYGASGIIDYIDDYLFEGESILLGEDGANIINRNSRLAFIATGKYWVNNHAHIMKANADNLNHFICEYLESLDYSKICAGSAQPKLTQDVIRNLTIKAPCKEEQQKIADCLSSLDSLIQTQQKVVTTWQQRKKALLQQMFI